MKKIFAFCAVFVVSGMLSAIDFQRNLELKPKRMNGEDVRLVQTKLSELGFLPESEIDGYYGPITERAVSVFRKAFWFSDGGVVDKSVFKTLTCDDDELLALYKSHVKAYLGLKKSKEKITEKIHDVFGFSTEGGKITFSYANGKRFSAFLELFGEYGKVSYLKTDLLPETDSYLLVILSCTYNGLFGEGRMTEDATSLMVYKGVQYVLKNGIFSPENVVDGDDVFQILDGKMEFTDE